MIKKINKINLQKKKRYLKKIVGTSKKPRLAIFRSHKHIYAQLIDDEKGETLAFSSTLEKIISSEISSTATREASLLVGEQIGKKATEKNIVFVVFDRGNRPYHGRIQSVAEGARTQGLNF